MRKSYLVILSAAMAISLAGCGEVDVPQAHSTNKAEAVLTQDVYTKIAQETADAFSAADEANDAAALTARVSEPALAQRTAQYRLKSLNPDAAVGPIIIDPNAIPISSGVAFPRSLVTYAAPAEGQNQRTLTAWQQASARTNYKLWGQIVLFSDVTTPTLASTLNDSEGFPAIDASTYLADPAGVVAAYAKYVNDGEVSDVPFAADDKLYTALKGQLASLKENVGDKGEIAMSFAAADVAPVVVSTDDGGAVVLGEMTYDITYKSTDSDQPIRFRGTPEALLLSGDADRTTVDVATDKPLIGHYSVLVALYVPAASAEGEVVLLGASTNVLESAALQE